MRRMDLCTLRDAAPLHLCCMVPIFSGYWHQAAWLQTIRAGFWYEMMCHGESVVSLQVNVARCAVTLPACAGAAATGMIMDPRPGAALDRPEKRLRVRDI